MADLPPPPDRENAESELKALPAEQTGSPKPLPDMSLMLEIVINGKQTQQVVPVRYRSGHYSISSENFNGLGLPMKFDDSPEVEIDTVKGLDVTYDSAAQQLLINIPTEWLPEQNISQYEQAGYEASDSTLGMLFNYDVYASHSTEMTQNDAISAFTEQRLLGPFGIVSNNGVYNQQVNGENISTSQNRYIRYDTKWFYNDEKSMLRYSAGDIITGSLPWSTSVRLGGLQLSRNFATRPDLITYPLPQFAGQAAVPSSVDVYIDSYKNSTSNVNPGPFTISTIPFINGAGNASVVVTDPLGRQVTTSVPFYVSSELLQKGLVDFSLSAGKIRNNYGLENFDYQNNAASATLRYGLTNWLTLEGRAENASQLTVGGAGGNIMLGQFGVLGGSYTTSKAKDDAFKPENQGYYYYDDITDSNDAYNQGNSGNQRSLSYSYTQRYFSINAQKIIRSDGYGDLSNYKSSYRSNKKTDQITGSTTLGDFGSLGMGYFDVERFDSSRLRLVNISYSTTVLRQNTLYTSINREIGQSGYSAQIILSIPLGSWGGASMSSSRDSNNKWTHQASYNRAAPTDGGMGWNLSYAKNSGDQSDYKQASLEYLAQKVRAQGGVYGDKDYTYWGELSGSFVAMGQSVYASRPINDAFALISTDGYPDVPVRYENQLLGKTDNNGYLLIPSVTSYANGKYEIDAVNLPADVKIPMVEQTRSIKESSGTLIEFPVTKITPATLTLVDESGTPLPKGSIIYLNGQDQASYVGWDGESYLEDVAKDNKLTIQRADDNSQCQVHFTLPERPVNGIQSLNTLVCNR
nr:fimbria/pilus outer membrane usher protein [Budvicia diplopodorum]